MLVSSDVGRPVVARMDRKTFVHGKAVLLGLGLAWMLGCGGGSSDSLGSGTPPPDPPAQDTQAPTVPSGATIGSVTATTVQVSWTGSTDNVGVTGYRVYRGSSLVGTTGETGYTDTGLNAGTTYAYRISALDAAGNASAQSTAVEATTSLVATGTTYHVSAEGSDSSDGLTPGTAWRTLAHVNGRSLEPGDAVLLRRGDTWREALEIDDAGTPSAYIQFGAYGSGDRPRILGSTALTAWTATGTAHVWQSTATLSDPWTVITADGTNCQVFFLETSGAVTWGYHETYDAAFTNLSSDYDWTWNANRLYVYSTQDPNTRFSAVEAPQRQYAVIVEHVNHVAIDSLEMAYLGGFGVRDAYPPATSTGLRVTNCWIHHIGRKGSNVAYGTYNYHSNAYYANNEIHDCGRRSISVAATSYDTQTIVDGVLIENNRFHHGFHTTGIDLNPSGSGSHIIRNVVIRNNVFEGEPDVFLRGGDREDLYYDDGLNSNHIFLADQSTGSTGDMMNVDIYQNVFTYTGGKAVGIENAKNIRIFHNTFYAVNPTLANTQAFVYISEGAERPEDISIQNNIFFNTMAYAFNPNFVSVKTDANWVSEITLNHNLYYSTDPSNVLVWVRGRSIDGVWMEGAEYIAAEWAQYKSATGWDAESPVPANPLFVDAAGGNLHLQAGSPAIDAGVDVGLGLSYNGAPDIGAFER